MQTTPHLFNQSTYTLPLQYHPPDVVTDCSMPPPSSPPLAPSPDPSTVSSSYDGMKTVTTPYHSTPHYIILHHTTIYHITPHLTHPQSLIKQMNSIINKEVDKAEEDGDLCVIGMILCKLRYALSHYRYYYYSFSLSLYFLNTYNSRKISAHLPSSLSYAAHIGKYV